jgi:hypothetical protein
VLRAIPVWSSVRLGGPHAHISQPAGGPHGACLVGEVSDGLDARIGSFVAENDAVLPANRACPAVICAFGAIVSIERAGSDDASSTGANSTVFPAKG